MQPSKTNIYSGSFPNNTDDRSGDGQHDETHANWHQQQSLNVSSAPLAFLHSPIILSRGDGDSNASPAEQRRKWVIDIVDEALDVINGKYDDRESLLFNSSSGLSPNFPKQ
ncbi:unnamed protein product [Cylindrotheca closterium]|uniref:Uncharacterized protein n=1 Tax=Cylindrotheca closterium TaxID=2856 RepID=A0AAD2FG21_9STRA|nr:unnamed protein product [Cylindrotheca closterium]